MAFEEWDDGRDWDQYQSHVFTVEPEEPGWRVVYVDCGLPWFIGGIFKTAELGRSFSLWLLARGVNLDVLDAPWEDVPALEPFEGEPAVLDEGCWELQRHRAKRRLLLVVRNRTHGIAGPFHREQDPAKFLEVLRREGPAWATIRIKRAEPNRRRVKPSGDLIERMIEVEQKQREQRARRSEVLDRMMAEVLSRPDPRSP